MFGCHWSHMKSISAADDWSLSLPVNLSQHWAFEPVLRLVTLRPAVSRGAVSGGDQCPLLRWESALPVSPRRAPAHCSTSCLQSQLPAIIHTTQCDAVWSGTGRLNSSQPYFLIPQIIATTQKFKMQIRPISWQRSHTLSNLSKVQKTFPASSSHVELRSWLFDLAVVCWGWWSESVASALVRERLLPGDTDHTDSGSGDCC